MPQSKQRGFASHFAFLGNFGGFLFPIGALALLSVPGIWLYQAREWMNSGHWPSISVADGLAWAGLAVLAADVRGSPLISQQFLDFPLSFALLALIGGPLIAYAQFSQWLERRCERGDKRAID
ncbi:MAG TPA: hypothetical protein VM308_00445 [Sphingomicrobium sp.]|nr:hypothetical protein [Sphingomicrobium sp.]